MQSPLNNLQQQVWDQKDGRKDRYLLVSVVKKDHWQVTLWRNDSGKSTVWAGEGDDTRAAEIADAITSGMLHVEHRSKGGGLKLFIHVPPPVIDVYLDAQEADKHLAGLVDMGFAMLSRPNSNIAEVKGLKAQLAAKETEIAQLTAKVLSLRATVSRQTATGPRRDGPVSPQKKPPPAAMNRLQPHQKRRRLVEEEFAGSDDSDEDDSEEEDDDD